MSDETPAPFPRLGERATRVLTALRKRTRDKEKLTEIDVALRQLEALDAAWVENEKRVGPDGKPRKWDSVNLARLQVEYCHLADVPLYGLDPP